MAPEAGNKHEGLWAFRFRRGEGKQQGCSVRYAHLPSLCLSKLTLDTQRYRRNGHHSQERQHFPERRVRLAVPQPSSPSSPSPAAQGRVRSFPSVRASTPLIPSHPQLLHRLHLESSWQPEAARKVQTQDAASLQSHQRPHPRLRRFRARHLPQAGDRELGRVR